MENDHIKHILEQLESGQLTASDAYDQLKLVVICLDSDGLSVLQM